MKSKGIEMLNKGQRKTSMAAMHDRAPIKMKLQQDMPVGGDEASKIKRCKLSDKGYHPMAKQEMKKEY